MSQEGNLGRALESAARDSWDTPAPRKHKKQLLVQKG